jgi:hypothetical protein
VRGDGAGASLLTVRAGPRALARLRAHGLSPEAVDLVPGASGGAKWLVLAGLDQYLFGTFLQAPRTRPLPVIGSSIGSWRLACLAQRDPVAALARGHEAYIHHQQYSPRPDSAEVSAVLGRALDYLLGPTGVAEILAHPVLRLHVVTARGHGLAARRARPLLAAGMGMAAALNAVHRRTLGWHFTRTLFHAPAHPSPFAGVRDLRTAFAPLTPETVRDALLASGSIPLLMDGVRVAGVDGVQWDGGVTDYHLALPYPEGEGIILYPHFYGHLVPGWFDKGLPWRRARGPWLDRVVLVAPSPAFVASLPGGKIPDRRDFYTLAPEERIRRWEAVRTASMALGEVLQALVASGRVADVAQPL